MLQITLVSQRIFVQIFVSVNFPFRNREIAFQMHRETFSYYRALSEQLHLASLVRKQRAYDWKAIKKMRPSLKKKITNVNI